VTASSRDPAPPVAFEEGQAGYALGLIEALSRRLDEEAIDYCHWKSTAALDRSASGENDLDLLVRRNDVQRFAGVLSRLGFKETRAPRPEELPGVVNYYGLDEATGRLVHVHAHFQLVLGHDRTKNYRLPLEDVYLDSSTSSGLFRIPEPEFEFVVLVLRMMLKYFTWEAALGREATLPASVQREWKELRANVDPKRVTEILRRHLPTLDEAIFREGAQALEAGSRAYHRVWLGWRLQRALRANGRHSFTSDLLLRLWRRSRRGVQRRQRGRPPAKQLTSGGIMIAFVGGDGAGKTTTVEAIYVWLSRHLDVTKVHLGKPSLSWTTWAVRGSLEAARLAHAFLTGVWRRERSGSARHQFPSLAPALRQLCTARDRRLAYARARRFANHGGVVVCDRFPMPEIRLMDAPVLDRMLGGSREGRFAERLIRWERLQYRPIALPEILVVLRVDPAIAVRRKLEEDPTSVHTRSREIFERDWGGTRAHVIDAGRPADEVLLAVKAHVWNQL
jgi:thymidylate kinase